MVLSVLCTVDDAGSVMISVVTGGDSSMACQSRRARGKSQKIGGNEKERTENHYENGDRWNGGFTWNVMDGVIFLTFKANGFQHSLIKPLIQGLNNHESVYFLRTPIIPRFLSK